MHILYFGERDIGLPAAKTSIKRYQYRLTVRQVDL